MRWAVCFAERELKIGAASGGWQKVCGIDLILALSYHSSLPNNWRK